MVPAGIFYPPPMAGDPYGGTAPCARTRPTPKRRPAHGAYGSAAYPGHGRTPAKQSRPARCATQAGTA